MKEFGFTTCAAAEIDKLETRVSDRARVYAQAEKILRAAYVETKRVVEGFTLSECIFTRGISEFNVYSALQSIEDKFERLLSNTPNSLKSTLEGYTKGTIHYIKCIACGLGNGSVQDRSDPDLPKFEKYLRSFNNEALEELLKIDDRKVLGDSIRALSAMAMKADYTSTLNTIERINGIING